MNSKFGPHSEDLIQIKIQDQSYYLHFSKREIF